MAQFRQQTGSGSDRVHDAAHVSIRIPSKQAHTARIRRHKRPAASPLAVFAVTLTLGLAVTFFTFRRVFPHHGGGSEESYAEVGGKRAEYSKELKFGHERAGSVGRDSRYWDRDDRRRDRDYDGEAGLEKKDAILGKKDGILGEKSGGDGGGGLYNEGGRTELNSYRVEYEASLGGERKVRRNEEEVVLDDEYDDDIDVQDDGGGGGGEEGNAGGVVVKANEMEKGKEKQREKGEGSGGGSRRVEKGSGSRKKASSKKKPKRQRVPGSSCEMRLVDSTAELVEPSENRKFSRFSLEYTDVEERPSTASDWEPRFAGHQTLEEREESFYTRDQKINCGFVKGPEGLPSTGFDLAEDDVKFMSSCHIAVSSCIFGNSDRLRTPFNKQISRQARKNVCFVMFMDESTLQTLLSEGQEMDSMGFIGLWKIIVVKNLPFTDMRRVGKIPKFLTHRLFPSASYSIWLDSKLRLQIDPYLILEYFLWRKGYEYAISNHYDRHCVWEEVAQNKKLNKYNHTIIDQQFEFYQSDGLTRFDPSDPNNLLPSYVPEGSFIIRAHTPMSNLFSCLWFNEVDHFTPRDQLSFAYTYLKLRRMNPGKTFHLNMFKDCERRMIAKLFHHRAEEKRAPPVLTAR